MAVSATPYGSFLLGLGTGLFDFTSDDINLMLTTSSYAPDADTHEFMDEVAPYEITGTGYTSGGQTLISVTWTYSTSNNWAVLDSSTPTWTTATFTTRRAVLYKSTGVAATSPLIGWVDFGVDKAPVAEDFVLNFTQGLLRLKIV